MNEAAIKQKVLELCQVITALPSGKGQTQTVHSQAPLVDKVQCSKTSTGTEAVENWLDQLRLQVKYLMFDLEATRRENRYLRQMIDNRRHPNSDEPKDGTSDF